VNHNFSSLPTQLQQHPTTNQTNNQTTNLIKTTTTQTHPQNQKPKIKTPKMSTIPHQLQASLRPTSYPLPTLTWLAHLLPPPHRAPPPLASLLATARTRLLATDLTTPHLLEPHYVAAHSLPANLSATHAGTREWRLPQDVVVQVLDLEDVGRGRWEVVEELEAVGRGEGTRGREVVRLPAAGAGDAGGEEEEGVGEGTQQQQELGVGQNQGGQAGAGAGGAAAGGAAAGRSKNSTHKLVVQDCKGQKVHAIELRRVERLVVGKTMIGEKILLRAGTVVARGVVLLDPAQCVVLGGKVEAWHRAWVDGRLARLREAVEAREGGTA
jgi:RecQ-mediated genome instability protein 1